MKNEMKKILAVLAVSAALVSLASCNNAGGDISEVSGSNTGIAALKDEFSKLAESTDIAGQAHVWRIDAQNSRSMSTSEHLKGRYSNQYEKNSDMEVVIRVDTRKKQLFTFVVYDVVYDVSRNEWMPDKYSIVMTDENGTVTKVDGTGNPEIFSPENPGDGQQIKNVLSNSKKVDFHLESKKEPGVFYDFSVDCDNFKEAFEKLKTS